MSAPKSKRIPLIDAAPWLCDGMAAEDFEAARASIVVEQRSIAPGEWSWTPPHPRVGYLILSGLMARNLHMAAAPALGLDLVGERDLLQPGNFAPELRSIPVEIDWTALTSVEIALLDEPFERAMSLWPALAINLMRTLSERVWSASSLLAARRLGSLEGRLLATLWMLADRWGTVSIDGVNLTLPHLTHERLADLVAATRPSVTSSLGKLRRMGLVKRRSEGSWLLRGDPAEALRQVQSLGSEDTPPDKPSSVDELSAS